MQAAKNIKENLCMEIR